MDGLHPVQRGGGIRKLADAIVKAALTAADATKIEAQGRKATLDKGLVEMLRDPIVHGPARLGVGMEDHRDRRARTRSGLEAALKTTFWTRKDNCWHVLIRNDDKTVRRTYVVRHVPERAKGNASAI